VAGRSKKTKMLAAARAGTLLPTAASENLRSYSVSHWYWSAWQELTYCTGSVHEDS
jgi:hypothetical protein